MRAKIGIVLAVVAASVAILANAETDAPRNALDNGASFTPEGTIIFHRHDGTSGGLFEMDIEGRVLGRITETRYMDRWPSVGADGKSIVFISTRDRRWSVYQTLRAGGDVELISDTSVFNLGAGISTAGEIVFAQNRDQQAFYSDILAWDPTTGATHLIVEGGMWPRWVSPTRFLFTRDNAEDGGLDVMMFDTIERSVHRLTHGQTDDVSATLSPDGQLLYWAVQEGDGYILHRRDLAGGEARSLGVRMNIDSSPSISPDGRFMVFGRDDGAGYDLIRLDLETLEEVVLTDHH